MLEVHYSPSHPSLIPRPIDGGLHITCFDTLVAKVGKRVAIDLFNDWLVTKQITKYKSTSSLIAALVGRAIRDGRLRTDEVTFYEYHPDAYAEERSKIDFDVKGQPIQPLIDMDEYEFHLRFHTEELKEQVPDGSI